MRGIVFGCFAESVPNKKFFQRFGNQKRTKESQKGSKGIQKGAKWCQKGAKGSQKGGKGSQKGGKGSQKGANMEPRGDQNAYKNRSSEKVSKSEPKGGARALSFGAILVQNPSKMPSKIHFKINREKTWKMKPKGCQNAAEIDVKTHQKSMPKQVSKKIRKIMKFHVFLKG